MKQYKMEDISYVKVRHKEQTSLVCPKGDEHCFDLFNSSFFSKYSDRVYKNSDVIYIDSFLNMLNKFDLHALLINSSGKVEEMISEANAYHILNIYNKIKGLNEEQLSRIDEVSEKVLEICFDKIGIMEQSFYTLLKNFIKLDLIDNGLGVHSAIVSKRDNLLDFKLCRTLKYLGLNIDLKKIPNFKINYNYKQVDVYDGNGNLIDTINFESKVKKLVDKKTK